MGEILHGSGFDKKVNTNKLLLVFGWKSGFLD
jgi:hypothetical protein